ncbi:MAG: transcription termination/antitermination protein NusG [Dehalococcoidales bacterium]|jgi:transcriptional antiterminator NusG|nr:transcription termination/antitermination protein NusG [Dehalococcoidales bacterium]MDX9985963.1 transcription termination/antitermination protein NusG [Dehalococcoidales bacterium]NLE90321.1 transcription termination/antitermination factor NusG [Dehalococcoidales bacterium]
MAGAVQPKTANDDMKWYVVHTYSGYEERVVKNLEQRRRSMDLDGDIEEVLIPKEEEVEIKNGQRCTVNKKILPGYILVRMRLNDLSWAIVRNTPAVTGFVSSGNKPTPLAESEVGWIKRQVEAEAPRVKVGLRQGQSVRVVDGPFIDFIGTVDEVDSDKGKVKVLLSLFGRETPVQLDLLQVEKL